MNASAFSLRAGLLLVAVRAALFLALLWMIGTGNGLFDNSNDGGSHAGGKGLNGFAGLVRLAQADGWDTSLARNDAALDRPGLLVLTPAADAPGKEIARIVNRHRRIGPVMVIAPKWVVQRLPGKTPGAKDGWVEIIGYQTPGWARFLDRVSVSVQHGADHAAVRWVAAESSGRLPDGSVVAVGSGTDDSGQALIPLVQLDGSGQGPDAPLLAAYVADARDATALDRLALFGAAPRKHASATADYPLLLVFEPDLLDNYGMADPANVALASRLIAAVAPNGPREIAFDLTLNGLGHAPNLLTLAFTPPYLAATLCLILAGVAAGWRSFCRFGAPRTASPELAFGKERLVTNAGSLILRARRLHLLGPPYVTACRERIARALALPRHADFAETEAAIDRALSARRDATAAPERGFAETAQSLHQAQDEAAIVAAARTLHELERTLSR